MSYTLSSRFSDSTIASSDFDRLSSASSSSSTSSSSSSHPKPPPRTSSITLASTRTYHKPTPLQLAASQKRSLPHRCPSCGEEEDYFSCKQHEGCTSAVVARRCVCGSVIGASAEDGVYCSTECARRDALWALEGRSSSFSEEEEEEEDLPKTPIISATSSPRSARKERAREVAVIERVSDIGERFRHMQHGWFEDAPEEPSSSGSLQELVEMNMRYLASGETSIKQERGPVPTTLFFHAPVYTGSPF